MGETRIVVLGTVQIGEGDRLVVPNLDLNAPVDQIQAALEAAEAKRVEERRRESAALKAMFLPADEPSEDKPPVYRDWLFP